MSEATKSIKNKIDNYEQTIIAIIGFMNFYRYDSDKLPVKFFQGRKLSPSKNSDIEFVTPDIGILQSDNNGVLGEVKHCFPKEQEYWIKAFEQLMKYDDDLVGWPNSDGRVSAHDLVLLTHQSRARAVGNYYRDKISIPEISFSNPFCLVEYNRTSGNQEFFFFRIEEGFLTDKKVNAKLKEGVSVPMSVFLKNYAAIKFYDDKPELPYLMFLIWVYMVLVKASENERFKNLTKSQKLDIEFTIDEITDALRKGYSFQLVNSDMTERQPLMPKTSWVKEACIKFVEWGEAKWIDDQKTKITFHCNKKYSDALNQFIDRYADQSGNGQGILFEESIDEQD
jgi:hypothetical protein